MTFWDIQEKGKKKRQDILGCKSWKFGCGGGKREGMTGKFFFGDIQETEKEDEG